MAVLVPYGVDNPMSRLPWMNWALIAANVAAFALQSASGTVLVSIDGFPVELERLIRDYGLVPAHFRWYQLVTSCFLHAGAWHLICNMVFLWSFGNNVNGRLGHWRYLAAYLGCGVAASAAQAIADYGSPIPCVGASGAVFGVMGLYLAFFPLNDVRMFYLIWIRAGTFECSSFWMIGLWVGLNILDVAAGTAGNVGVWAHMGGFAVGFGVGLFLLRKGFVERDDYDFFSWIGGRRERKLVARLAEGKAPTEGGVLRSIASAREMCRAARTNLDAGEVEEACEAYGLFAEAYPLMALDEASQLKVANALLHAKDYEKAAEAFVRFARYYPKHAQAADALYSAGILHVHQLSQTEKGCRLLSEALPRLKDAAKAEKARRALSHAAGAQPR